MPDPRRAGAYTASDNAVRGRGSGHARLIYSSVSRVRKAKKSRKSNQTFFVISACPYGHKIITIVSIRSYMSRARSRGGILKNT